MPILISANCLWKSKCHSCGRPKLLRRARTEACNASVCSKEQAPSLSAVEANRLLKAVLTPEQVPERPNVSADRVRDHSSRKNPSISSKEVQPNATSNDVRTALPLPWLRS